MCPIYANQGSKIWYLCYHSSKFPATSFVHVDPPESSVNETADSQHLPKLIPLNNSSRNHKSGISVGASARSSSPSYSGRSVSFHEQPRANSTILEPCEGCESDCSSHLSNHSNSRVNSKTNSMCQSDTCEGVGNVGDVSHIPRVPPSQSTYVIPHIKSSNNHTLETICDSGEDIFGMIKLKENDVCYTSGTIEWVGRKRSFPLNSGFKLLNESQRHEPHIKKVKTLDATYICHDSYMKDCYCADILPTVNAIVDHLNALHEAVDLVDLRVNTLENAM